MDINTYYINKKYSQLTQKSGCYETETTLIVCLTDEKKLCVIYYCRFLCKLQKRHSLVLINPSLPHAECFIAVNANNEIKF